MEEDDEVAEEIAEALHENLPRCPRCGRPLRVIIENVSGVCYTWEFKNGSYHLTDQDHYGQTTLICGYCDEEIDDHEIWDFFAKRSF